jgi:signal transduction histidine kinase
MSASEQVDIAAGASQRWPGVRDWILAGVVTVLHMLAPTTGRVGAEPVPAWLGGLSLVLTLALGISLAWRRIYPRPVAALVLVATAAYEVLVAVVPPFAAWIVLWTVIVHGRPGRRAVIDGVLVAVGTLAALAAGALSPGWTTTLGPLLLFLTVVIGLLAALLRTGRSRIEAVNARAESLARERAAAARQAAAEERLRIARDLHDLVGHGLSTIAVQSSTARLALDAGDTTAARTAMAAVEATSRGAMREMRQLLGVLREAGGPERAPSPGLADLDALAEGVRAAGMRVEVERSGDLTAVPAAVELSAYRVAQEALTNVVKHAPGASVAVQVTADGRFLRVRVADDGTGATASAGSGHGLVGITERVGVLGGTVEAGPTERGWVVEAVLPLTQTEEEQ